ncbi:MAG: HI0074 family nucleotidyltransferase substrate-binding subunit [Desulfomicrobium sp.]|nr:HI0074 family nucleotidyltransferase substrate-binding subunit [Desulfomicrobium sp.]
MTGNDADVRWEQRFADFKKALALLKKFVEKGQLNELEEQGAIQAFEYTYELAWNVMKDFLEHQGQADIYGSRDAIRKAFQLGLIKDGGKWMDAYVSRTKTSHTYNEETAREVVDAILGVYHGLFEAFEEKMESLLDRDHQVAADNRFGIESSVFERIVDVLSGDPMIEDAIISGSRAKGVHKSGSDIDVVLKGKELTLQDLNRITLALDDLLLPYTFDLSLFHHIDNAELLAHIGRVGKSIFRRQG